MLYYNGIGVFEGIDVNKASASKNVFRKRVLVSTRYLQWVS